MYPIKSKLTLASLSFLAAGCAMASPNLVFSEDFSGLSDGTAVTTANSDFNYIGNHADLNAKLEINQAGTSTPLLMQSHNAGNVTFGMGVDNLPTSDVYSFSLNFSINQLPGGTNFYFAFGDSGSTMYPASPNRPARLDNATNLATLGSQSAFVVRLGGNTSGDTSFGMLASMTLDGSTAVWTNFSSAHYDVDDAYYLHMVVNTGLTDIEVSGEVIGAGKIGLFIDEVFIASIAAADKVSADSFRIYSSGRSTGSLFGSIQLGEMQIWDGAVAPIPEAAQTAVLLALAAILGVSTLARKNR